MDDLDHIEELLDSAPIIAALLALAQGSSATPKVQVLRLAGALARAAIEGYVPDSYVLDAVRTVLAAAKAPDPAAN